MRTNIRNSVFFIVLGISLKCSAREPFKPRVGSLPFIVYFQSRYRGLCVGTLVSRSAVITAAVCVTNPTMPFKDTRPINVVTGATYRHPRAGIRVQVTKVLVPRYINVTTNKGYLMQKSPAILLLKRKVPDVLTEVPLRALDVDYKGEEVLSLQEECLMPGWHFFYRGVTTSKLWIESGRSLSLASRLFFWNPQPFPSSAEGRASISCRHHLAEPVLKKQLADKIYPVHKFMLQRNVRVQFLNIVKKKLWCEALTMTFQKALSNMGYLGYFDGTACLCVRDPDRTAQPCHGMYGAPLICRGRAVAMLMAPDAQWTNCTGYSNIVHLFSGSHLRNFMKCVSSLFDVEVRLDWNAMKKSFYEDPHDEQYDYVPELYDKLDSASTSSDEY